jgi:hypothetical protein
MRSFVCLLAVTVVVSGCSLFKSEPPNWGDAPAQVSVTNNAAAVVATPATAPMTPPSAPATSPKPKVIVTPDTTLAGSIVRVNDSDRFAVLNFPVDKMPAVGAHMNIYRKGLKVGELKVTGPQQDDDIVGDLTNGEAQIGDDVRPN